ncbi:MAG: damage-inducible protein DinB [Acidobacteria bacterium]|nr:damage-inducible protein DinB [Acidobacteriota bacterium]
MRYQFLTDTYETERLKVLSAWSMFRDRDLPFRPHPADRRGRSLHEQMVHQCVSEDLWFRTMLGIDVNAPPLPKQETRLEFIRQYAADSGKRLEALQVQQDAWWEEEVQFFDIRRSRAWVMVRRIAHTSHHRGQQTALLRMLHSDLHSYDLHSTYGPTSDTGGLMQNKAPVIYAYTDVEALLEGEAAGGRKARLPGPGEKPPTERP